MTENGSRGAKRCLFGRDNKLSDDLDKQVKEDEKAAAEAFTARWNFEIQTETPLPGRYQWEKIDSESPASTSVVSHLTTSSPVNKPEIGRISSDDPSNENSDTEVSSVDDSSVLSLPSTSSAYQDVASSSCDEKDVNQNIVREPTKRKASNALTRDETGKQEAKRAKPP